MKRRVLLAVCGLSPQVVTESLYALTRDEHDTMPLEVHVLTTAPGAERTRLMLLSKDPGWYHRFCREYGVERISFLSENIHVITDEEGALDDIRTPRDNEAAADQITELIRDLTADPDVALHVSIAGGRKTMGFYAGYALSLYGRQQDRLSHVLVSPPFESHPDFFYPTRETRIIYSLDNTRSPLDSSKAEVTLAEIPFVRLRDGLPSELLTGRARFSETVAAAQAAIGSHVLRIDTASRELDCGGRKVRLPPAELAFYLWMAERRHAGLGPVRWTDADAGEAFLRHYGRLENEFSGAAERTRQALQGGMTKEYFEQRCSKVNRILRDALGSVYATPFLITPHGKRPLTAYGLMHLLPGNIFID